MPLNKRIPDAGRPLSGPGGVFTSEWYRYLASLMGYAEIATAAQVRAQASGNVLLSPLSLSQRASFSAWKSADQVGIATGVVTLITFNQEEWDTGSIFASNRVIPPANTIMRLSAGLYFSAGVVDGAIASVILRKNGADWKYGAFYRVGAADTVVVVGSWLVNGNGTDYFEVYGYATGAGNKTVGAGQALTYFQGEQI